MSDSDEPIRERTRGLLEAWLTRTARSDALHTLLAEHTVPGGDGQIKVYVSAVLAVPGANDARYRGEDVAAIVVASPEEEAAVLDALALFAHERGARFEPAPRSEPAWHNALAWIARQSPAPLAEWTVEWTGGWLRLDGTPVEKREVRTVTARTASEACAAAWAARGGDLGDEGGLLRAYYAEWVHELGGEAKRIEYRHPTPAGCPRSPAELRALSVAGMAPTGLLDRLAPACPRDRMCALAEAWHLGVSELGVAGAYVRGDLAREQADEALTALAEQNRVQWELDHRVCEAIRTGVVDAALLRDARSNPIRVLVALRDKLGVGIGSGKLLLARLDEAGPALLQPGELSRTIERALRDEAEREA